MPPLANSSIPPATQKRAYKEVQRYRGIIEQAIKAARKLW